MKEEKMWEEKVVIRLYFFVWPLLKDDSGGLNAPVLLFKNCNS